MWLDPDRNLALTGLAIHQVSNLWLVAKSRYTGETFDSTQLRPLSLAIINHVISGVIPEGKTFSITVPSMRMSLLYYSEPD